MIIMAVIERSQKTDHIFYVAKDPDQLFRIRAPSTTIRVSERRYTVF